MICIFFLMWSTFCMKYNMCKCDLSFSVRVFLTSLLVGLCSTHAFNHALIRSPIGAFHTTVIHLYSTLWLEGQMFHQANAPHKTYLWALLQPEMEIFESLVTYWHVLKCPFKSISNFQLINMSLSILYYTMAILYQL